MINAYGTFDYLNKADESLYWLNSAFPTPGVDADIDEIKELLKTASDSVKEAYRKINILMEME